MRRRLLHRSLPSRRRRMARPHVRGTLRGREPDVRVQAARHAHARVFPAGGERDGEGAGGCRRVRWRRGG